MRGSNPNQHPSTKRGEAQSWYSVPAGLARKRVMVRLHADRFDVIVDGKVVAGHTRSLHKGAEDLELDHYLEVLARKPGALAGSTALAQARASGAFTGSHEAFWVEARRQLGDGPGTRALCKVLLLHRSHPDSVVTAGIDAALRVGSVDPDVVAIEARHAVDGTRLVPVVAVEGGAGGDRPAPSLTGYDDLLAGVTR